MNLVELKRKAHNIEIKGAKRRKRNYQLAKKLGFTTTEAVILQHQSETTIKALAKEKK